MKVKDYHKKILHTTYPLGKGWEPVIEFSTTLKRSGIHIFGMSFIITLWHACKNIQYIIGCHHIRFHTILQELCLKTACTFRFDSAEIVFVKILALYWLHVWLVKISATWINPAFSYESFDIFLIASVTCLIRTGSFPFIDLEKEPSS